MKAELPDALPENHPSRKDVLEQFKKHIAGVATQQAGNGSAMMFYKKGDNWHNYS